MRVLQIGDTTEYVRNILATYQRATDADIAAGRSWYRDARETARIVGKGDIVKGAGVLAAFSPRVSWKHNIELAADAIERNRFTGHFPANNRKARKIWDGKHPESVLGGDKVRAFYSCIVTAGKSDTPCIDRHATAVAHGRVMTDAERRLTSKKYRTLAESYRIAARKVGLLASELQAVVWVTWRREKGLTD